MRIWAKVLTDHKIVKEVVGEFSSPRPSSLAEWAPFVHELCQQLDLSRPVLLMKHFNDLRSFSRVVFHKSDFMEPVDFDLFEIEVLSEKKKRSTNPYSFA